MTTFTSSDNIMAIIIVLTLISIAMLVATKSIANAWAVVIVFVLLMVPVSRIAVPPLLAKIFKKEFFGVGTNDYWAMIQREINDTPTKYGFSQNFQLPKTYFPYNNIVLPQYGFALFEINRDDLLSYLGEDADRLNFIFGQITLVFGIKPQKVVGQLRGKGIEETVNFLEEHKESFIEEKQNIEIPSIIRELIVPSKPAEPKK